MKKLTPKQEAFCLEYLVDLNGTQAAIRAGYSPRTAEKQASENLRKPEIAARISAMKADRAESVGMTARDVLSELVELLRLDAADLVDEHNQPKPMKEWPLAWRRFIVGFEVKDLMGDMPGILTKFKLPDRVRVLEMIGKHVGVNAFDLRAQDESGKKLANIQKAWALYQAGAMTQEEYGALFDEVANGTAI